jgi:deoxycytidine triphosphate deaminase
MGALSDGEIRERIAAGQLILGGDERKADASSYEFRAGMIVRTGRDDPAEAIVDWTDDTASAIYYVEPGELVWVRTRETVDMPHDLCAFWWQTNRLSRYGLMLVNMTMVEPGYKGPLACLFANFGRHRVEITRDTVVARLVFFDLNRPAERPYDRRTTGTEYDRALVSSATNAPRTFLDLEALSRDVREQFDEAVEALKKLKGELTADATKAVGDARDKAVEDFASDTKGALVRAIPTALVALALLTVASLAVGWVNDRIRPSDADVRTQIEDTLDELADNAAVTKEVSTLRNEIAELRRQIATPAATPAASPTGRP